MTAFGLLLALAAVAWPVLVLVVPHGVVIPGLIVGLAARPRLPHPAVALLPALALAWAVAGAAWAPAPTTALLTAGKVVLTALLGLAAVRRAAALEPAAANAAARLMTVTVLLCLATLAVETASGKWISITWLGAHPEEVGQKSVLNHGMALLALPLWPLAVALGRLHGRAAAAVPVAAAVAVAAMVDSQSGRIALAVGLLFMAAACWRPTAAFALLRAGTVAVVLAAPLAASAIPDPQATFQWRLPNSAHHRLTIWSVTAEGIGQHPLRGWGLDAARALPGGDDEVVVVRQGPYGREVMREQRLPLHPHSGALQLWLELGLPGALAGAVMLWLGLGRLARAGGDATLRAAWGATAAAAFTVANLSYGLWQSWWQAELWLLAVFAVALGRVQPTDSCSPAIAAGAKLPEAAPGEGNHNNSAARAP